MIPHTTALTTVKTATVPHIDNHALPPQAMSSQLRPNYRMIGVSWFPHPWIVGLAFHYVSCPRTAKHKEPHKVRLTVRRYSSFECAARCLQGSGCRLLAPSPYGWRRKIIQHAVGIESDDVANYYFPKTRPADREQKRGLALSANGSSALNAQRSPIESDM